MLGRSSLCKRLFPLFSQKNLPGIDEQNQLSTARWASWRSRNPTPIIPDERTREVADRLAVTQLVACHCEYFRGCLIVSSWTSGISVQTIRLLCQNSQSFLSPPELKHCLPWLLQMCTLWINICSTCSRRIVKTTQSPDSGLVSSSSSQSGGILVGRLF